MTERSNDPLLQPGGWTLAGSWSRDGITRQFDYRSCDHSLDRNTGRCSRCRAKHVGSFVQVQSNAGHGGTPIGSPYIQTPKLIGTVMKAGAERITPEQYNHTPKRRAA